MRHIDEGYRGFATFVHLNADRLLATGAVACAVMLAAWIQTA